MRLVPAEVNNETGSLSLPPKPYHFPPFVPGRLIGAAVHCVHEVYRLFFHQLRRMEATLARNFHGTVAKAALDLLYVDPGFA